MKYDITISLNDDENCAKVLLFKNVDFKKECGILFFYNSDISDPRLGSISFFSIEEKRILYLTISPSEERGKNE